MRIVLIMVACGTFFGVFLGDSAVAQKEEPKANPKNVIQVQVTGMLLGPETTIVNGKLHVAVPPVDTAHLGGVYAEGQSIKFDCAGNKAAEELLKNANLERSKQTGFIPTRLVEVKGRLQFRPITRVEYDAAGNRIERADSFPIIVVESLKILD